MSLIRSKQRIKCPYCDRSQVVGLQQVVTCYCGATAEREGDEYFWYPPRRAKTEQDLHLERWLFGKK